LTVLVCDFEGRFIVRVEENEASCEPCAVIGILDDGWAGLSDRARQRLLAADLVIGAGRTLDLVRTQLTGRLPLQDMDAAIAQVPEWIKAAHADGRAVAVLATGDPLCHGIAPLLIAKLGRGANRGPAGAIHRSTALRTLSQNPGRRCALPPATVRTPASGCPARRPTHGLYRVLRAIALQPLVAVFTGAQNTPARLARALIAVGHGDDLKLSVACRLQLPDEQLFPDLTLAEVAEREFPEPNVLLVERTAAPRPVFGPRRPRVPAARAGKGLDHQAGSACPVARQAALAPDATVWDIGAGSGAVGLEAAALAPQGHVWAIEKNVADAANARANAVACVQSSNYTLVEGKAPSTSRRLARPRRRLHWRFRRRTRRADRS
jgi:precorrin-6Y C5,15-methyltransferase (decarboxylating)